jgi:hypothetical protein
MTVAESRRSRLAAAKSINDIEQGDYVRRVLGGRKIKPCGCDFDVRRA